jgi:hypothetical protein
MNETLRITLLWILTPIGIYLFFSITTMMCMLLTPKFVHDCPKCAASTIGFATFMAWVATQGAYLEKAYTALIALAVWA